MDGKTPKAALSTLHGRGNRAAVEERMTDPVKFEFDPNEPDEQAPGAPPAPDAASPEENAPAAFPPDFRMHRAFDHARTRARADISRVRSALNQMHYTVQVAHSEELAAETFDTPAPDVFRPEAFRARTSH